ncbi:MAG: winged helix-turn-helix transcriptional regulator [Gaiellaceae bacterium]
MRCRSCAPIPKEVRQLAGLLERRSSISVIWASSQGVRRFNEFAQALRPVAPGTLTARLTELEEAGILARVLVDDRPPRVEYRLTKRGERVAAAVALLADLS